MRRSGRRSSPIRSSARLLGLSPFPVAHFGNVFEMFHHVLAMLIERLVVESGKLVRFVGERLIGGPRLAAQRFYAQVVAAGPVEHEHVEWRRGRALFDKAAHMEAVRIWTAVEKLVDRAEIAMECKDHVLVQGEELLAVGF